MYISGFNTFKRTRVRGLLFEKTTTFSKKQKLAIIIDILLIFKYTTTSYYDLNQDPNAERERIRVESGM